jgi:DNA-directed RNA polymerase specialized sigma24 family protein
MSLTPNFRAAAYHINCVLNGMQHQWCDEPPPVTVDGYQRHFNELREELLPYLAAHNPPLARALTDALQAVEDGKSAAPEIVQEALERIAAQMPEIHEHRVDFATYCGILSENRAKARLGIRMRNPNIKEPTYL